MPAAGMATMNARRSNCVRMDIDNNLFIILSIGKENLAAKRDMMMKALQSSPRDVVIAVYLNHCKRASRTIEKTERGRPEFLSILL
jgi:hypothetical protein